MRRKDGGSKAGFHKPLDGLSVVGLHQNARGNANLFEKTINHQADVAAFWIEKKWNVGKVRSAQGGDASAADFIGGRANDKKFFIEKRN